jgi:hypothetical protein
VRKRDIPRRSGLLELCATCRGLTADERHFAIQLDTLRVSTEHRTDLEREVMTQHRWWTQVEVSSSTERIWPDDLVSILVSGGIWNAIS